MNDWQYQTASDLDQTMSERLKNFPREPDMMVFALRSLVALIIRGWLKLYHRLEIIGREHLPKDKSFVIVANHTSHLDAPTLAAALPLKKLHRVFPAAAADYFFKNVPRTWFSAVVVNALPFDRKSRNRQSLGMCQALLQNPDGNVLIIFPEGTRSVTGQLNSFKPGIGLLVAGTEIPIVSCFIEGAYRAWPKGKFFPRPRKIRLTIQPPQSFENLSPRKEDVLALTQTLENSVKDLQKAASAG